MGAVSYTFGQGVRYTGISMVKPEIFAGSIASVSGSLNLTVAGSPSVGALLSSGVPYYLEIVRDNVGGLSDTGDRFDINSAATASASAGTIVLRATTENTISGALPSSFVGANFVIRPHFTLGSLSTDLPGAFLPGDLISIRVDGGSQISATRNASGSWLSGINNRNSVVIYPGVGFFVVRSGATTTSSSLVGAVRSNTFVQVIRSGNQLLSEGFPVDSAPNPSVGSSRLFTNPNGTVFANGDRLAAVNPSNQQLTTYTYNASTNRWNAGLANGNLVQLFSPTRSFFLNVTSANPNYVQPVPFTM